ncbi:peptidase inhibitor family I36 protein [Streptomyces sp. NPDC086554]|uniref:peptidase inhibitor family I36 protein n=1 Tax=Streptomyces sp. NPDC086554 TaxID=3154864 RepID=UPI003429B54E
MAALAAFAAVLAAATPAASTGQSAASCPRRYVCFWEFGDFSGKRISFDLRHSPSGNPINLSDQGLKEARSAYNRSGWDVRVTTGKNGSGASRCLHPGGQTGFVLTPIKSFIAYGGTTGC